MEDVSAAEEAKPVEEAATQKVLRFHGQFNLRRLAGDLADLDSALAPIKRDGEKYATTQVLFNLIEDGVEMWVPIEADESAITKAVEQHDAAADPIPEPQPTRDERIAAAADVRKQRLAAKRAAIAASALPAATKAALIDVLDGMADIVDGLVEALPERPK